MEVASRGRVPTAEVIAFVVCTSWVRNSTLLDGIDHYRLRHVGNVVPVQPWQFDDGGYFPVRLHGSFRGLLRGTAI